MPKITGVETFDVRFPTSKSLDGSDAMNQDPDYSGAYLRINTDAGVHGGRAIAGRMIEAGDINADAAVSAITSIPADGGILRG